MSDERRGLLYVGLAVAAFSTSPVLIVWADPMPALIKTWGRLCVAALVVGFTAWLTLRKHTASSIPASHSVPGTWYSSPLRFTFYGLVAALHFFCYIAALDYTTAAHALALVYTAPIFVTLFSAFVLREPLRGIQWAGVTIAVIGVAILAGLEPRMTTTMAFGDLLAVGSALTFGIYTVAGRYERDRYPLLVYASRVYGSAALWLLPLAFLVIPVTPPDSWGLPQVASVVALGIIPLALGHTLYNAALRRLHATVVNIIASQEVTGGILLSLVLLAQVPSFTSLVGALVTLVGIALVIREQP
ncbi:MAG: DMT family transporter [Chloroflexia bacterium]